jgi:hypothetical protein
MKKWIVLSAVLGLMGFLASETLAASVQGYYRKDGTYVQPHQRTNPNGKLSDNYSFPGNYNPNTGTITPGDPGRVPERSGTYPNPFQVNPYSR